MKKTKSRVLKIFIGIILAVFLSFTAVFLYFYIPSLSVRLDETRLTDDIINVALYDNQNIKLKNSDIFASGEYIQNEEIPEFVKDCFIYIEDKRFYEHDGIDRYRMAGAIVENIKAMRFKEGASTITQQLIKNTHLSNEKNFTRKLSEIRLAQELETKYSKDKILEMYLNSVYFGNNVYGITKAAKYYFDKTVQDLTLEEGAVLAGMINAPSVYCPNKNPEKCLARRNIVLKALLDNEKITPEVFDVAVAQELDTSKIGLKSLDEKSYADMVMTEASEILGLNYSQLKHADVKIYTYLNKDKQNALVKSLQSVDAKTLSGNDAQKMAISLDNQTGGVEAFYASTASNPFYNTRQVGSVAKPLVALAPSFEQHLITPATMILDEQTDFGGYAPSNVGEKYDGWLTVRNAIAKSKNVPAVKLLNALNRDKVKTNLTDIGFLTDDDNVNLNMALGVFASGLTIKQLAQGYMTLANDGIFQNAEFIRKIEDSQGRVLYKRENETKKVFAEDTAYLTTDVLKDVVSFGTAKSFDVDIPLAGKTGTVGKKNCPNNSDAIFCSYTPKETTVFWVFSDYDDLLSEEITGSSAPVNLANSYYANIYKNNNAVDFSMPKTVTKLKIDKITLENSGKILIANNYIPKSETTEEIFSIFNMPTKVTKRNIPQQQKQQTKEENSQEFFKNFFNTLIKRQYLGA